MNNSISIVVKGGTPVKAYDSEQEAAEWAEKHYPDESVVYPDVSYSGTDTVYSDITEDEIQQLRDAFWHGRYVTAVAENEGATWTLLFETPDGHIGVTIGSVPARGSVYIGIDEWEQVQHHETDSWVWVRKDD